MGEVYSLSDAAVHTALPAADLERAKTFFREKLGLAPIPETEGTALYRVRDGQLALFATRGRPSGDHTQIGWTVTDIEATVAELRDRGVQFDEYDDPGFKTVNGIVSFGSTHFAWFRDSEGNVHNLAQYG
jgi:catechol 2,3-dioxygenase-like lactoylglutathione lyase family enzyme